MKRPTRLHYFQHEPFEGLGSIEEWALLKGFSLASTHLYKNDSLPELEHFDWLVVMGGSMSVNDEAALPWLRPEKAFVKQAILAGKVVIGICLGAQMIANVLGSKVQYNEHKEIGWFPIHWDPEALRHTLFRHIPPSLNVMHWHGETFEMPLGAMPLAKSKACMNQGFLYKEKVLGLQFHPEFDEKSTDEMLAYCSHELQEGAYVQSGDKMIEQRHFIIPAKAALFGILDALANQNNP